MAKKRDQEEANSWRETRDFCTQDRRLREFGFTIRSRPKHGPNLWNTDDGHVVSEAEAIKQVQLKIQSVKK